MSTYDVVLLAEQALSEADARRVVSLHEAVEDPVVYHVLIPVEDAAAEVQAGVGALGAGEMLTNPTAAMTGRELEELQQECIEKCQQALALSVERLTRAKVTAHGRAVADDPVGTLATVVEEVDAAEAIILTQPHVVAEFFHVDWTSRARRKLGVPVLHLIEHETFEEQAETYGEEGVTGF